MAGKKKGKKKYTGQTFKKRGGRPSKADFKAAHGDMKKAWALHRAKGGGGKKKKRKKSGSHTKTTRKAAKSGGRKKGRTAKQKAASKRNIKKAQASRRKGHGASKKARKSGSKRRGKAHRRPQSRTTKSTIIKTGRHTKEVVVVKVPSQPRKSKKRKGGGKKKKGRSGAREHYMAENPLGAGELILGGFTGVLGFLVGDGVDRFLATHALTDKNTKDSTGNELYADTPPSTGSYSGLYNATAIAAPMDLLRWGVGLGVPIVFVLGGRMIRNPMGRSGVQMFGFVWGVRTLGKGLTDLVAYMTRTMAFGQRLYDAEMRAGSMAAGTNGYPLASLPSTGLGRKAGCCSNCAKGLPCTGKEFPPAPPPPPAGYAGLPPVVKRAPEPVTVTQAPQAAVVAPANNSQSQSNQSSSSMGMYSSPRFARRR